MAWKLDRVRRALFALTVFALPWQIRWFSEGPSLAGYPWEQGRISIYAVEILILFGICLRLWSHYSTRLCVHSFSFSIVLAKAKTQYQQLFKTLFIPVLLVSVIALHTISPRATLEWCLEWGILIGFIWSALDLPLSRKEIVMYLAIALIPHAILGVWQYLSQVVIGSKWLGMATQLPATLGVSVVQVGSERVLRAYGGFPHPNIFGAWLVVAILGVFVQLRFALSQRMKVLFGCSLGLFSVALILTFSRGAWLALIGGGSVYFTILFYKERKAIFTDRTLWLGMFVIGVALGLTGLLVRDRILVRIKVQTRLEEKSIDERAVGLKNGWEVFRAHPFLGSGPGTMLLAISERSQGILTEPPVPPHFVPLILLAELGMAGVSALVGMIFLLRKRIGSVLSKNPMLFSTGVGTVLFLGSVDHFLWTTWSGRVVMVILLILSFF